MRSGCFRLRAFISVCIGLTALAGFQQRGPHSGPGYLPPLLRRLCATFRRLSVTGWLRSAGHTRWPHQDSAFRAGTGHRASWHHSRIAIHSGLFCTAASRLRYGRLHSGWASRQFAGHSFGRGGNGPGRPRVRHSGSSTGSSAWIWSIAWAPGVVGAGRPGWATHYTGVMAASPAAAGGFPFTFRFQRVQPRIPVSVRHRQRRLYFIRRAAIGPRAVLRRLLPVYSASSAHTNRVCNAFRSLPHI